MNKSRICNARAYTCKTNLPTWKTSRRGSKGGTNTWRRIQTAKTTIRQPSSASKTPAALTSAVRDRVLDGALMFSTHSLTHSTTVLCVCSLYISHLLTQLTRASRRPKLFPGGAVRGASGVLLIRSYILYIVQLYRGCLMLLRIIIAALLGFSLSHVVASEISAAARALQHHPKSGDDVMAVYY